MEDMEDSIIYKHSQLAIELLDYMGIKETVLTVLDSCLAKLNLVQMGLKLLERI